MKALFCFAHTTGTIIAFFLYNFLCLNSLCLSFVPSTCCNNIATTQCVLTNRQARILARQFKELAEKESRKWSKKAEGDKARYQDEMKGYVPAHDPDGGGKKGKKAKKDPDAPKRNMSAYFLYSIAARPVVKEENPEATFGDIARLISAKFKALSEKERKVWEEKAKADKERYERDMEEYKG